MKKLDIDSPKTLKIVIPTRGSRGLVNGEEVVFVENLITKLEASSLSDAVKIVAVVDEDTPAETQAWLSSRKVELIVVSGEFNFSKKCNVGALHNPSEFILFLNDDMDIIEPEFVQFLMSPFDDERVGIVGANLRFPDGSIQHVGHSYAGGEFRHIYSGLQDWETPHPENMLIEREVSGVTAACLMTKSDIFFETGGFSELFPVNFNDVDFCLKVRQAGRKIIWAPKAKLFHFESKTRVPQIAEYELANLISRWGSPTEEKFKF